MSYIDRNLLPDERIQFRTGKHLIIFLYPVLLGILAVYAFQYMHANEMFGRVEWALPLVALLFFASVWLNYITSEFVVTNKRIMMREGFFVRHMAELRIQTISQINVEQDLIGQVLGYGSIGLNAFGATDVFTTIANPSAFQRYANIELDKVTTR